MPELVVDFITSLDGSASAAGWPGWWGIEGPEDPGLAGRGLRGGDAVAADRENGSRTDRLADALEETSELEVERVRLADDKAILTGQVEQLMDGNADLLKQHDGAPTAMTGHPGSGDSWATAPPWDDIERLLTNARLRGIITIRIDEVHTLCRWSASGKSGRSPSVPSRTSKARCVGAILPDPLNLRSGSWI